MAKQYNMYNVQLSEFWKQRVGKEALHNAPYLDEDDDNMSQLSDRAPSRAPSEMSVTSEASRQKVGARALTVVAGARGALMGGRGGGATHTLLSIPFLC